MTPHGKILAVVAVASTASLLCFVQPVQAQPRADQVLTDMGFSSDDRQQILNGQFVSHDLPGVSEKDLALTIAFLVKTSPADLGKQVMAGSLISSGTQVMASGEFSGAGSMADLSGLQISGDMAQALSNAQAGETLNLSTGEITAFNAVQGQQAVQQQLQHMLLARFQAYKTSGLSGIAPYARSDGSTDVGGELRKASEAAQGLQKYLPHFQAVLLNYPNAAIPEMRQDFHWLNSDIRGSTTFVLVHTVAAPDGTARAVLQRQYYASTGYNAEQAVAAFLPVQEGTVVVYTNHTFTDQVAEFGSSMKRDIGRRMMASKLKAIFDSERQQLAP